MSATGFWTVDVKYVSKDGTLTYGASEYEFEDASRESVLEFLHEKVELAEQGGFKVEAYAWQSMGYDSKVGCYDVGEEIRI